MVNPNKNVPNPELEQLPPDISFADLQENGFKIPNAYTHAMPNGETVQRDRSFGQVGDTITDIKDAEDFEKLEHMIVHKLTGKRPEFSRKRSPTGGGPTTLEDPISWKLKPKKYHGDLTNGSAVVIPEPGKEEGQGALTLLFMADTKVGPIQRAVTYRVRGDARSKVQRKFHPSSSFDEGGLAAEARAAASARESYKVASSGVRKAFSAGLPGTARR